jgi:hypothetical protein
LISAYPRRLDPLCLVLIGAFDFSERLVGLAEAHPIAGKEYVEIGITVGVASQRRGLGGDRAPWLWYSYSASGREFNFLPSNLALVRLV